MTETFPVRVTVLLKDGVLDPEGSAIATSLRGLGFEGLREVRSGKVFRLDVAAPDPGAAVEAARLMAERLLANPVLETFRVEAEAR